MEVLEALAETYLGKVKMIYIDPPYNTGTTSEEDDFAQAPRITWETAASAMKK